jgi:anti-sigma regulatory factor (Ser/Thr protein kinase)
MDEWLETHLPATALAAAEAREFLRAALKTWALDGLGDLTELLATELVTNAVAHVGEDPIVLRVRADAERLRVEVQDPGNDPPILRRVDDTTPGGRGVLIVDALASDWGTLQGPPGSKTVWFEIDVETATGEMHPSDREGRA